MIPDPHCALCGGRLELIGMAEETLAFYVILTPCDWIAQAMIAHDACAVIPGGCRSGVLGATRERVGDRDRHRTAPGCPSLTGS